jgi:hypothetical protein
VGIQSGVRSGHSFALPRVQPQADLEGELLYNSRVVGRRIMPYKNSEDLNTWKRQEYRRKKHYLERRSRNKAIADEYKSKPCADCGQCFPPYVMDFDHVRGEKSYNVSYLIGSASEKKLRAEIEKCDVVCANCHRIRTWKDRYR